MCIAIKRVISERHFAAVALPGLAVLLVLAPVITYAAGPALVVEPQVIDPDQTINFDQPFQGTLDGTEASTIDDASTDGTAEPADAYAFTVQQPNQPYVITVQSPELEIRSDIALLDEATNTYVTKQSASAGDPGDQVQYSGILAAPGTYAIYVLRSIFAEDPAATGTYTISLTTTIPTTAPPPPAPPPSAPPQ